MKVYIAARYSRKHEVGGIASKLRKMGFEVVSTWHKEVHVPSVQLAKIKPKTLRTYAERDLLEVRECEVLLFLSESDQAYNRRGGRHVEFGYALALGKGIAVVGPHENIFHHLKGVQHHDDVDDFVKEWDDGTIGKRPTE